MKTICLAAICQEKGKNYAFVVPVKSGQNIKPILERYANTPIFHLCDTRKEADDLVLTWNNDFKANGTYMFA